MGKIEVICGGMFSGKTEELLRRIRRAKIAKQKTIVFKPNLDDRYKEDEIVSHDKNTMESIKLKDPINIIKFSIESDVIGIDEGQFFGDRLISVCEQLANEGKRVIVAGLDLDYKNRPFEPMPSLMAIAEEVMKIRAVCMVCGNEAGRSKRLGSEKKRVVVGEKDKYEARCRGCFDK